MANKIKRDLKLLSFPPRIIQANYFSFSPGQRLGPHWDASNLFILVNEGKGTLRAGRRDYSIREGMACCIPWATPVSYNADKKEPMKIMTLHLEYRPWRKYAFPSRVHTRYRPDPSSITMQKPPFPQPFSGIRIISPLTHSALFGIASRIVQIYDQKKMPNREALLRASAILFVHEVWSVTHGIIDGADAKTGGTPSFYELIYQLQFHYADQLTTKWLADRAKMSYTTLHALFKKKTGVSPMEYVIQMRIHRAGQLLRTTPLSIKEIAVRVGIDNPRYFSRLFGKRCGLSPSQYRNED